MSPSAMKPYGILRVCRAWRLSRATVQRHKVQMDAVLRTSAKRGPKTPLSDDGVLAAIRAVLASNLFVGGGHRKARTRLCDDHGGQFISNAFQNELKNLGIESSPSFVRQPEGNGCPVFQD